jgi:hypothetical protein
LAKRSINPKKSFGFSKVEGGFVAPQKKRKFQPQDDPRNAWSRDHLPVHESLSPGHFVIWLAATDEDGHTSETGSSACAWMIRGQTAEIIATWPGDALESSEKKAFVAAAAGALDQLPAGSTAEIVCREKYIVDAINGGIIPWYGRLRPWPGEKYPRQLYGLIWLHFLDARKRITSESETTKSTKITARRPRPADADDRIIESLMTHARNSRPKKKT